MMVSCSAKNGVPCRNCRGVGRVTSLHSQELRFVPHFVSCGEIQQELRHNKWDEMTQDQMWEKQSLLQPKLCGSELAFTHKFSENIYFYFMISL